VISKTAAAFFEVAFGLFFMAARAAVTRFVVFHVLKIQLLFL